MDQLPFNILFLGAGYGTLILIQGTRLQRDLATADQKYASLKGIAKALLPLARIPLISHWINSMTLQLNITPLVLFKSIFIICNAINHAQFKSWAHDNDFPMDHIKSDSSESNESRLGAVMDLQLAIQVFSLEYKPLLVIAGDTLFLKDFSLVKFLGMATICPGSLVTHYLTSDDDCVKTGILETQNLDGCHDSTPSYLKVINFLEKPHPAETKSRNACPCFYYLRPQTFPLIQVFADEKKKEGGALCDIDATGKWIQWLIHHSPIYTTLISGRLDIGGLQSLIEAEEYISKC